MTDMVVNEVDERKALLPAVESRGPASPADSAKKLEGGAGSEESEEDAPAYMHVGGAASCGGWVDACRWSSRQWTQSHPDPIINPPVPQQATSFAVRQEDETWELPVFLNHVDKPMLEMQVGVTVLECQGCPSSVWQELQVFTSWTCCQPYAERSSPFLTLIAHSVVSRHWFHSGLTSSPHILQANSNVWYQAHILNHSTTELYVLFPGTIARAWL